MRTPLEIRNDAWECLQQAEQARAQRDKAILLILAQGWASLADEMERLTVTENVALDGSDGAAAPAEGAAAANPGQTQPAN